MSKQVIALLLTIGMLLCFSSCDIAVRPADDVSGSNTTEGAENVTSEKEESVHIHSYVAATCTSPKMCTSCGETIGDALEHNFLAATCTNPQICSRCGETSGDPLGHDYDAATCTLPQTCIRCDKTEGEPLGHEYVDNICFRCGQVDPDSLPVALEELFVVDSSEKMYSGYHYDSGSFTDSFGNVYDGVHLYRKVYNEQYSIHNLNGMYSVFEGSIVAASYTNSKPTYIIRIYVDDVLMYSETGFTKTTGKVNFSVDVSGGTLLTIKVSQAGSMGDYDMDVGIVNAQLRK